MAVKWDKIAFLSEVLSSVSVDATLTGNGTIGNPLGVAGAYLSTVATDATLTGEGTLDSPLSVVGGSSVIAITRGWFL